MGLLRRHMDHVYHNSMKHDDLKQALLRAAISITEKQRELAALEREFDRLFVLAGGPRAAPELPPEAPTLNDGPRSLETRALSGPPTAIRPGSISDQVVKLLGSLYPKSLEIKEIAERLKADKPEMKPESVRTIVDRLYKGGMIARAGHGTYQAIQAELKGGR